MKRSSIRIEDKHGWSVSLLCIGLGVLVSIIVLVVLLFIVFQLSHYLIFYCFFLCRFQIAFLINMFFFIVYLDLIHLR